MANRYLFSLFLIIVVLSVSVNSKSDDNSESSKNILKTDLLVSDLNSIYRSYISNILQIEGEGTGNDEKKELINSLFTPESELSTLVDGLNLKGNIINTITEKTSLRKPENSTTNQSTNNNTGNKSNNSTTTTENNTSMVDRFRENLKLEGFELAESPRADAPIETGLGQSLSLKTSSSPWIPSNRVKFYFSLYNSVSTLQWNDQQCEILNENTEVADPFKTSGLSSLIKPTLKTDKEINKITSIIIDELLKLANPNLTIMNKAITIYVQENMPGDFITISESGALLTGVDTFQVLDSLSKTRQYGDKSALQYEENTINECIISSMEDISLLEGAKKLEVGKFSCGPFDLPVRFTESKYIESDNISEDKQEISNTQVCTTGSIPEPNIFGFYCKPHFLTLSNSSVLKLRLPVTATGTNSGNIGNIELDVQILPRSTLIEYKFSTHLEFTFPPSDLITIWSEANLHYYPSWVGSEQSSTNFINPFSSVPIEASRIYLDPNGCKVEPTNQSILTPPVEGCGFDQISENLRISACLLALQTAAKNHFTFNTPSCINQGMPSDADYYCM